MSAAEWQEWAGGGLRVDGPQGGGWLCNTPAHRVPSPAHAKYQETTPFPPRSLTSAPTDLYQALKKSPGPVARRDSPG